jgi:hypothetical protein
VDDILKLDHKSRGAYFSSGWNDLVSRDQNGESYHASSHCSSSPFSSINRAALLIKRGWKLMEMPGAADIDTALTPLMTSRSRTHTLSGSGRIPQGSREDHP